MVVIPSTISGAVKTMYSKTVGYWASIACCLGSSAKPNNLRRLAYQTLARHVAQRAGKSRIGAMSTSKDEAEGHWLT